MMFCNNPIKAPNAARIMKLQARLVTNDERAAGWGSLMADAPSEAERWVKALKKKGVVKSVRGPQGGYVLTKKPSDISLKTLFYVLADEVQEATNGHSGAADGDEICAANQIFWKRLRHSIDEGLGGVTLKDLLDEARKARKGRGSSYAFNI